MVAIENLIDRAGWTSRRAWPYAQAPFE